MGFAENVGRAAKTATCSYLANGGNAAITTYIVDGARVPGKQVAAGAAGLGLLAVNYGCSYDPKGGVTDVTWTGCKEVVSGYIEVTFWSKYGGAEGQLRAIKIVQIGTGLSQTYPGKDCYFLIYVDQAGKGQVWVRPVEYVSSWESKLVGVCKVQNDPNAPATLPTVHHKEAEECDIDVDHLGWYQNLDGSISPVYKMQPVPKATQMASGGVISGCNWGPIVYMGPSSGGGGGGGKIIPWVPQPDGDDGPWWLKAIKSIADDAAVSLGKALVDKLLETKTQPVMYRLRSICEVDEDGEAIDRVKEVPIPASTPLMTIMERLDALTLLLQAHKDFKQPICSDSSKPANLTGEWVSVNFESEDISPAGNARLRKYFRYRDQSASSLEDHALHWKDFSWKAGPVCVIHKGLSWGVPQVWAETAEEGKRVIGHAASIAGVDLTDAKGRWLVRTTGNPRYGQPGLMKVRRLRTGGLMISKRVDDSGLAEYPVITETSSAP